jgi:hypothetical protein
MSVRLLLCAPALLLISTSAYAESFEHSVTESILNATISNSSVTFAGADIAGNSNSISGDAFKGALGIVAIVQNTGTNATVQQAVTVHTGNISLSH